MRNNKSRNGADIALLPLEARIDCHRENLTNKNENTKRKKRLKAIKTNKRFNLDADKMNARLELAEKAIAARDTNSLIAATDGTDNNIYCCKTGAIVGQINAKALALVNQLEMPSGRNDGLTNWQLRHSIHPAWLNTSSKVLAQLQRIMPHEYCIYIYTYLIERHSDALHKTIVEIADMNVVNNIYSQRDTSIYRSKETKTVTISSIPATFKHDILEELYTTPLYIIIEIAELLRIFAALVGKNKAFITAMPSLVRLDAIEFRNELLAFIRTVLQKEQKQHHAKDTDRSRFITMVDLYYIMTTNGMKLFNEAKINLDDDNPILADVADLFREAGLTSTMVAKDYSHVKHLIKKKPEYSAKVVPSETNKNTTELKPITL